MTKFIRLMLDGGLAHRRVHIECGRTFAEQYNVR